MPNLTLNEAGARAYYDFLRAYDKESAALYEQHGEAATFAAFSQNLIAGYPYEIRAERGRYGYEYFFNEMINAEDSTDGEPHMLRLGAEFIAGIIPHEKIDPRKQLANLAKIARNI